jgi:hypothetical protein
VDWLGGGGGDELGRGLGSLQGRAGPVMALINLVLDLDRAWGCFFADGLADGEPELEPGGPGRR